MNDKKKLKFDYYHVLMLKTINEAKSMLSMRIMSCLLIDDHEEEHEFFKLALERTGMPAILDYASNSITAFQKLVYGDTIPNVIFLDVHMPRMNGMEFLAKIKQTPHLENVPVYVFSITLYEEQINELLHLGAESVILKPQSLEGLVKLLREVLSNQMNRIHGL